MKRAVVIFLCHGFSFPIYDVLTIDMKVFPFIRTTASVGAARRSEKVSIDSHIDLIARDLGLDPVNDVEKC